MGELNGNLIAKNQCLLAHTAAGMVIRHEGREAKFRDQVRGQALILSAETYAQAKLCFETIGELETEPPLLRAELKART